MVDVLVGAEGTEVMLPRVPLEMDVELFNEEEFERKIVVK